MEYYRYVIVALQYHKLIDSASHNLAQFNGIHATTCALFQHFIRELLQCTLRRVLNKREN